MCPAPCFYTRSDVRDSSLSVPPCVAVRRRAYPQIKNER
uniref:Uncharacterized protein n=1 Tax=Siphoviridae sp. ct0UO21 TaxID=2825293 RepID=A0A8S5PD16_9CAUD|nr:MAG TPA: hypothetical protein [Siphoviridae sp. ct0UO21]